MHVIYLGNIFSDKSLHERQASVILSRLYLLNSLIKDVPGTLKINHRLYSLCRVITSALNCHTLRRDTLMLPDQQERLLSHLSTRIPRWRHSFFRWICQRLPHKKQ